MILRPCILDILESNLNEVDSEHTSSRLLPVPQAIKDYMFPSQGEEKIVKRRDTEEAAKSGRENYRTPEIPRGGKSTNIHTQHLFTFFRNKKKLIFVPHLHLDTLKKVFI